jgi:hypothetical protein
MLNILAQSDPPCPATGFVVFAGASWAEFREAQQSQARRKGVSNGIKAKKAAQSDPSSEESDQIDYAEIFANEKIVLTFQSGNTVPLTYGTFTTQDAISLIGPPSEVYTKSDTRLNIHNGHRHDEIETGPLSEGTPPSTLLTCSSRVFLQLLHSRCVVVIFTFSKPYFTENFVACEFTSIP